MQVKKLEGKVALVTGGGSGIGLATAVAFAREGANVVIAARGVERSNKAVQTLKQAGGEAMFVKTDVSKAPEVEALINEIVETYGRLDCAFNNSGIGASEARVARETEETWNRTIDTNLKGVWLCMRYEIPQMLKQLGYAYIPQSCAELLNGFNRDFFNPYINFHRPCFFPVSVVDIKGKTKKTYPYEEVRTPYGKLESLIQAENYLRPGVTFEQLETIANQMSDNQFAERMVNVRSNLFQQISRFANRVA